MSVIMYMLTKQTYNTGDKQTKPTRAHITLGQIKSKMIIPKENKHQLRKQSPTAWLNFTGGK